MCYMKVMANPHAITRPESYDSPSVVIAHRLYQLIKTY